LRPRRHVGDGTKPFYGNYTQTDLQPSTAKTIENVDSFLGI